jgi:alkylhydroperoxidase/carboxymuconolactone decarboxylase family protein YurZ
MRGKRAADKLAAAVTPRTTDGCYASTATPEFHREFRIGGQAVTVTYAGDALDVTGVSSELAVAIVRHLAAYDGAPTAMNR